MRIARFVTSFPARAEIRSGIAPNIYYLSKREIDLGHKTAVFTFARPGERSENVGDIPVYRVSKPVMSRVFLGRMLESKMSSVGFRPDIVHAMNAMPLGWLFRRRGPKYVLSVHTPVLARDPPELSSRYLQNLEYSLLLSRLVKRVNLNIAVSRFVMRELMILGVPKDRIRVVPSGLDPGLFASSPNRRSSTNDDEFNVMYVGRMARIKGLVYLVRAADILKRQGYDWVRFELVGGSSEDEDYEKITQMIRRMGLAENVVTLPPVPHWSMPDQYSKADAFVLPSVREPLGKVVLEAMGCGVPVLASNEAGIPDLVRDGKNGVLFASGNPRAIADAVISLASNRRMQRRLMARGKRYVDQFSWDKISDAYLQAFEYAAEAG